jgi:hypothetical protein
MATKKPTPIKTPTSTPISKDKLKPPAKDIDTKAATFPSVSVLAKPLMQETIGLMEEDIEYQEQIKLINAERARVKERLVEICLSNKEMKSKGGVRFGTIAVYYGGDKSRKSLSKKLLIENGYVTPAQLEECYVDGKTYTDLKVKDLSKAGNSHSDEGED